MNHHRVVRILPVAFLLLPVIALLSTQPRAFDRYQDGCNSGACHGVFTDALSTKGSVFPADNKHEMHRASSAMNTDCDLCHTSGDNRNPFIGSSNGTSSNPGLGCTGCHTGPGLRKHHENNGVTDCEGCHGAQAGGVESAVPTYYGTSDTNADNPCNPVAAANVNENWTIGDFEGLDNDGDNLYDGADSADCAGAATPGEAAQLIVDAHDATLGTLTLSYTSACGATDNSVEYGDLAQVATLSWSGRQCGLGNSGSTVWSYPVTPNDLFFLIVANDAIAEGSYGLATAGERAPDPAGCFAQDLSDRCD